MLAFQPDTNTQRHTVVRRRVVKNIKLPVAVPGEALVHLEHLFSELLADVSCVKTAEVCYILVCLFEDSRRVLYLSVSVRTAGVCYILVCV